MKGVADHLIFRCQAEEWLYFHRGTARATVFLGGALARTFDFTAGDTAVFPDNSGTYLNLPRVDHFFRVRSSSSDFFFFFWKSMCVRACVRVCMSLTIHPRFSSGHYIENTSKTEKLIWIELYKSERVADISLTQWLALTPADIVANTLNISIAVVQQLKKEKQILIK